MSNDGDAASDRYEHESFVIAEVLEVTWVERRQRQAERQAARRHPGVVDGPRATALGRVAGDLTPRAGDLGVAGRYGSCRQPPIESGAALRSPTTPTTWSARRG